MNNFFNADKLNKKNALKAGLFGLVAKINNQDKVFKNLSASPAQSSLLHNTNETKENTTPIKFIGEFYLDRLVNNNLTEVYTDTQLKEVASKQAIATKKHLTQNGEDLTIDSFKDIEFNKEFAKTLADIERSTLGETVLSQHTEEFFGNYNRTIAQDALQQNSLDNNWKQASAVLSQYNFDSRGIFADMDKETSETQNTKHNQET
jgi:hypothetical protein